MNKQPVDVSFYGKTEWPIDLEIIPPVQPVAIHCVQPSGNEPLTEKPVQIAAAPRTGRLAVFQTDFSQADGPTSVQVRQTRLGGRQWLSLDAGGGEEITLAKAAGEAANPEFALVAKAPPGAGHASVVLDVIPQSQWLVATPSNITVTADFEPGIIKAEWFTNKGEAAGQPPEINFGEVHIPKSPAGLIMVVQKPAVDTCDLLVPNDAVTPAAECKLTGPHAEAFELVETRGDIGGGAVSLVNGPVKFLVRPRFFSVPSDRLLIINLSATLEIRSRTNFVFSFRCGETSVPRAEMIAIPLKMEAHVAARIEGEKAAESGLRK